MSKSKYVAIAFIFPILFCIIVACAGEDIDAQVVRKTVVVEVPVTVVVTQFATVEAEATRIIEVPVTIVSTPTREPTVSSSPTPYYFEPYPFGTLVEIAEVDAIIREILTKDSLALRERIIFQESTCINPNDPYGSPCQDDEEIGAQIEVFRFGHCEGYETRDLAVISGLLEDLTSWPTGVYAVTGEFDSQAYEIILTSTDNDNAIIVFTEGSGISSIIFGCEQSPTEMLELFGNELVLPPISSLRN